MSVEDNATATTTADDDLFNEYYYSPPLPSAYGGVRNLRRGS